MSSETLEEQEKELKDLEQQIEQVAETEKAKAAQEETVPSPEPSASPAPEPVKAEETPAAPTPSAPSSVQDDPLKWAEKKGYKSPEDMARALLQKEQEFHQSRQKAEREAAPPPPVQNWQPRPDMNGGYGYPPPPPYGYPPAVDPRNLASEYGMTPEDFDRVARVSADMTRTALARERANWEREMGDIRRTTARNNELMTLMQDPAFRDERVQKEVHAILDSDPSIFQRERTPLVYAFKEAVFNMGRKQLQQGAPAGDPTVTNRPPVTAGGGNGSAFTMPRKITEAEFNSWSLKDQEAFINSNGRTIPKK